MGTNRCIDVQMKNTPRSTKTPKSSAAVMVVRSTRQELVKLGNNLWTANDILVWAERNHEVGFTQRALAVVVGDVITLMKLGIIQSQ